MIDMATSHRETTSHFGIWYIYKKIPWHLLLALAPVPVPQPAHIMASTTLSKAAMVAACVMLLVLYQRHTLAAAWSCGLPECPWSCGTKECEDCVDRCKDQCAVCCSNYVSDELVRAACLLNCVDQDCRALLQG